MSAHPLEKVTIRCSTNTPAIERRPRAGNEVDLWPSWPQPVGAAPAPDQASV
jgi:hypothetical protein